MNTLKWTWFLLAATLLSGCNRAPSVQTYPITGTVSYDGKPVADAIVNYANQDRDRPSASGTTDGEGRFSLTTYVSSTVLLRGAPPGDYKVTISKGAQAAGPSSTDMANMSPQEREAMTTKMMRAMIPSERGSDGSPVLPPKPKSEIPEKYGKAETSGLRETVVSGENPPKEYKLTDG